MGGSSTTTQNNSPYAPAQPMINQGLADAQAMYESGGVNITPYQGNLVAETDPFRNAAYGAAPSVAMGAMGGAQAAQGGLMRALDPNYQSAAFDQVRQNVVDTITPQINSSFAGSGMTGSTLHQQNLARGLSSGLADVENQAFQQSQQRALQAAGMMGQANQNMMAPLDYLRELGGERQQQSQAEIQAAVLQDQQAKTGELAALQDYLALSTGAGGQFGVQSSTSRNNPGLLGIAGLGLQGAALFSDRRLKTDIKRVGQTDDGLPIYTYRYITGGPVQMGVMAQEVEQVNPDAVTDIGGYKGVNYGKL